MATTCSRKRSTRRGAEVRRRRTDDRGQKGQKPLLFTRPPSSVLCPPVHFMAPTPSKTIYVLNGPNLNLLGTREPEKYGHTTLADVETLCREAAKRFDLGVEFRQSNHEGTLVDWIQEAREKAVGVVLNPAGYTTTSIAILDAILAAGIPVIEIHITNIHAREAFRHDSYVSKVARAVICGVGVTGYTLAISGLAAMIGAAQKG